MYTFVFLFVLLLIIILLFIRKITQRAQIERKGIICDELPKSFGDIRIFFITDICNKRINSEIIQNIDEKIDMVIIGGNLVQKGPPIARAKNNIHMLEKLQAPIYFVWGDQDYQGDYHNLDAMLLETGVKILANSAVNFESYEGDRVSVMGFDNKEYRKVEENHAFQDAKAPFKILTTHNVESFFALKPIQQREIHIVLSGRSTEYRCDYGWLDGSYTHIVMSKGYRVPFFSKDKGQCHVITIASF